MNSSSNNETASPDSFVFVARRSYAIDDNDWLPLTIGDSEIPGYFWIPLSSDDKNRWSSYWMKIEPGAQGPQHRHEATELILVYEGTFTDSDGKDFAPGNVITYATGSNHSSSSRDGCVVLVVAREGSHLLD
ncbi:cupin domain-containing protein [Paraburkholderia sp. BL21I4N1]|uniref:cupin domain-containing protein n=1 Tax=Paraburkholderia sp. BL21I4N1 TaxID=1938801 RepID=UPI000CFC40CF|nr:cupin domain-containing protein [Paraburkholderia sp. BL21I4N1]PQV54879.1 ChrR-like protein with cupin domain [Paraburkholderia sp. BL21I4N1]